MAKYQGHKNWNHWNVSLWINKDEPLYHSAKYFKRVLRDNRKAAEALLECLHNDFKITHTPDGAKYNITTLMAVMRSL